MVWGYSPHCSSWAQCQRSVRVTSLVRCSLYICKIKESLGKEQMYAESAKQGLKPWAPPLEKVAASMALQSSRCQHPPPQPTQQLPSSWEILPACEGPRGVENRRSPSADPSLCLHQGRDRQVGGAAAIPPSSQGRWDHAWDGAGWEQEWGLFPEQPLLHCQNGQNGWRRQPEPIHLFIYSFQSSPLQYSLQVTRRRIAAHGQWHLDSFCLVLIQMKPQFNLRGGFLN